MDSPILVLTTVNAPYSKKLDALESPVVCSIRRRPASLRSDVVVFGEVQPELQFAFARMHGITDAQLIAAAKAFAAYSGQTYPLAA